MLAIKPRLVIPAVLFAGSVAAAQIVVQQAIPAAQVAQPAGKEDPKKAKAATVEVMTFPTDRDAKNMIQAVKDYMKEPVRLTFGSTLKPHENVRVQAFEVAVDRKMELLQRLASAAALQAPCP